MVVASPIRPSFLSLRKAIVVTFFPTKEERRLCFPGVKGGEDSAGTVAAPPTTSGIEAESEYRCVGKAAGMSSAWVGATTGGGGGGGAVGWTSPLPPPSESKKLPRLFVVERTSATSRDAAREKAEEGEAASMPLEDAGPATVGLDRMRKDGTGDPVVPEILAPAGTDDDDKGAAAR